MDTQMQRSIVIEADAPSVGWRVGEVVRSGEVLGRYRQQNVRIPFDGMIASIFCDARKREAHLTLVNLHAMPTSTMFALL